MFISGRPVEYFAVAWPSEGVPHLGVVPGSSRWQSFWELLTLLLALCAWAEPGQPLAALGDNKASLQDAVCLGGKRQMAAISREIAWRQVRRRWSFACGHLPAEANTPADARSRLSAPDPSPLPPMLHSAVRLEVPAISSLWKVPNL